MALVPLEPTSCCHIAMVHRFPTSLLSIEPKGADRADICCFNTSNWGTEFSNCCHSYRLWNPTYSRQVPMLQLGAFSSRWRGNRSTFRNVASRLDRWNRFPKVVECKRMSMAFFHSVVGQFSSPCLFVLLWPVYHLHWHHNCQWCFVLQVISRRIHSLSVAKQEIWCQRVLNILSNTFLGPYMSRDVHTLPTVSLLYNSGNL